MESKVLRNQSQQGTCHSLMALVCKQMGARMFLELTEALLSSQMAAPPALVALEDTFLGAFTFVIGELNDEGYTKDFGVWSRADLCTIANAT